jgi:hypothetical protein
MNLGPHPAIADSLLHRRGVGGRGATATLLRAIAARAVGVRPAGSSLEFHLVPGVATGRREKDRGHLVEHGHVEGLSHIDRMLLSFLFDEVAHAPAIDLEGIRESSRDEAWAFWDGLHVWREAVNAERDEVRRHHPDAGRRDDVSDSRLSGMLRDSDIDDGEWVAIAQVAFVHGLDAVLASASRERHASGRPPCDTTGPGAVAWLCTVGTSPHTALRALRRCFSPWRPPRSIPAQYTKLIMPRWYRVNVIDDGSTSLGGE